jgi:SAM-dependent methyltransferase
MNAVTNVDPAALEAKVKDMYKMVALHPEGRYHFELGHALAGRLGYTAEQLHSIPWAAVESFAGVGFYFDLAELRPGEVVVDLGSGSGMDVFYAAGAVGPSGQVLGIDFTPEQLDKARDLAAADGFANVEFLEGHIDLLPVMSDSVDCVISNGVINLVPDKRQVFAEVTRVLRPGGRLALADIVTERPLTEAIVCNVDLWASCIGGASHENDYFAALADAGLVAETVRSNDYGFLSGSARGATETYGVKSISVLARKPA